MRKVPAPTGPFTVTHDISRYTKAQIFSEIGKQTPMVVRFSTVAGERGADLTGLFWTKLCEKLSLERSFGHAEEEV